MMEKKYIHSVAHKLLNDDFFLESIKHPTKESELFWEKLKKKDKHFSREFQIARTFIETVAKSRPESLTDDEAGKLWKRIEVQIAAEQKKQRIKKRFTYAASIAACISVLILGKYLFSPSQPLLHKDIFSATSDSISYFNINNDVQLILSKGEKMSIAGKENSLHYEKGGSISIQSDTTCHKEGEEGYNLLIVPAGKRSSITFSDGTQMAVNANTRVKYPVDFLKEKREIYVDGEVYLQVSRNKKKPFTVITNQMKIAVLGTEFNVCAYEQRKENSVILVSGKVEVKVQKSPKYVLSPNEMLIYNEKQENPIQINTVDAAKFISWVKGYYYFELEKVKVITERLSQYYGQRITAEPELGDFTCSGKLDLREDLKDVLETLSRTIPARIEYKEDHILLMTY